ncbi:MAG: metal ABC transporter permease, partial [Veillonella sp.]|nr:metal ABC transporter permease [Veillonella sp.]
MIHNTGLVNEDASIGIIFPLLFSIAIILVSLYSGNAHLDVDTALLGEIAFAPFDRWIVNGTDLGPISLWISLGVAILVIGLMIGPAAIAYLWTDSVKAMLTSSIIIGIICAVVGTEVAFTMDVSIAGSIATTIGIALIIAVIATPKTGYIATYRRQRHLRRHYRKTMMLCHIYHQAASQLKKQGLLYVTNGHYVLTDKGIAQVKEII